MGATMVGISTDESGKPRRLLVSGTPAAGKSSLGAFNIQMGSIQGARERIIAAFAPNIIAKLTGNGLRLTPEEIFKRMGIPVLGNLSFTWHRVRHECLCRVSFEDLLCAGNEMDCHSAFRLVEEHVLDVREVHYLRLFIGVFHRHKSCHAISGIWGSWIL
jgi:hypothetical protein